LEDQGEEEEKVKIEEEPERRKEMGFESNHRERNFQGKA
jgi:hypothetical protein